MDGWPDYDGKHEPPDPKWLRWALLLFCVVTTAEMVRQGFALLSWWMG